MRDLALLFAAGIVAGAMNALAGGGSFVTLPALIAIGVPSVNANASSTVALMPGSFTSAWVYRAGLGPVAGVKVRLMLAVSVAGGVAGALLLLWTPTRIFDAILPWLLLLATLALAFGRRVAAAMPAGRRAPRNVVLGVQFVLGIYGGYFGGAVGLMMLAAWSVMGEFDIKALQGARTLLVSAANLVASVVFAVTGAVWWPQTAAMLAGGLLGGYAGARLGRMASPGATRAVTLAGTASITAVFFWRAYGAGGGP